MTDERTAEIVPRGEREALQQTAQAMGERMGRQDQRVAGHDDHFARLNGSIDRIDGTLREIGTTIVVQAATIAAFERKFRADDEATDKRGGTWERWKLALFAASITLFIGITGFFVTAILTLVTLYAGGRL